MNRTGLRNFESTPRSVANPEFRTFNDAEGKCTGINIKDWTLSSNKTTISSSSEIDKFSSELGFALPEMIFGSNFINLENKNLGFHLSFDSIDALKEVVKTDASSTIKVSYSKDWLKEREHWEVSEAESPFDWTYTTKYAGTLILSEQCQKHTNPQERIDLESLKAQEPILFYTDNILFEDELGDNGSAMLNVKARVMPSGIFILQRFSLRVDDVLYRFHDTRVYHRFGTNYLIKEFSSREFEYKHVTKVLEKHTMNIHPGDRSYLADMGLVYASMINISPEPDSFDSEKITW